ncbi:dynamin family protein [Actinomycetospora callitridis]|uniref:dynamin family protein n=1 Tax=Actinomycetospora callitridis TaxID=913944 RepID=UPI002366CE39|nr:dynamin family protein [Actinomycetospora callitridis]MDD7918199.1 dynamin family protein [Actinomycetospora callitridis]
MTIQPPATTTRGRHPLTDEVLALVADVRATAVEDDEAGAAEALDADVARVQAGNAAVVVVGEKKRGKSSLINALIGRPGLLPVDADVATCVHIVVSHGPDGATVVLGGGPEGREVGLDAIAEYAALDPGARAPEHEDVSQVQVRVPAPLLEGGLELIDTPGVGGLVAGHAALTLATLNRADALVFVLDGSSEITASELAFLERATERIATVVFAITKIDQFPSWEAVRARDIELIAHHAPRYADAPWFGVSSRAVADALAAEADGELEEAAQERAASGIDPLSAHLAGLAEGADGLRLANLLHQASATVKRLSALQVRRALSLSPSPEFAELVKGEKAALTALQGQNATWRQTLGERSARLEQRMRTELNRRLEDLRKEVGDRIAVGNNRIFDEVGTDLPPRAQALWIELDTLLRRELTALGQALLADLEGVELDVTGVVPDAPERLAQLPEAARGAGSTSFAEQGIMAAGLGMGLGHLVALVVAPPIGILAGVGAVGFFSWRRWSKERGARSREDARRYLGEVATRLNNEIPPVVSQAVAGAREVLGRQITEALTAEKERLTASLAEHEKNLASEKSAVARRKAEVEARLRRRNALRETAEQLATRLPADREESS